MYSYSPRLFSLPALIWNPCTAVWTSEIQATIFEFCERSEFFPSLSRGFFTAPREMTESAADEDTSLVPPYLVRSALIVLSIRFYLICVKFSPSSLTQRMIDFRAIEHAGDARESLTLLYSLISDDARRAVHGAARPCLKLVLRAEQLQTAEGGTVSMIFTSLFLLRALRFTLQSSTTIGSRAQRYSERDAGALDPVDQAVHPSVNYRFPSPPGRPTYSASGWRYAT
ncbi:hypothetical protein LshimejAT787_1603020 [Lyophyllum shimeji]|uniref:Uncharacterized protein n=1 Tax=Lyophyllum shimeji TaxID=47721 RepID=A0A9P3Q008_LYOSH|nr:hypothetical protein LshimejAT787_1603020 [Lyophyllum shimeji]